MGIARILLVADSHLGFDFPFRPRIQRRRRGPEFFANFKQALQPALEGNVNCVVHGGDILFRSKVPPGLVEMAFEPLKQVADKGIPVFVVPGNHERSVIPHQHLAHHPQIHIFDRPRTFMLQNKNVSVALAGFPFKRHTIRRDFKGLLAQTDYRNPNAQIRILCIHQAVDGATVGPGNYMFRYGPEVVNTSQIPGDVAAVLCGHIHRFQVLSRDMKGNPLTTPVFYPGSIERTSFAEKDEKKGYLIMTFESDGSPGGRLKQWTFHQLPARPMIQLNVHPVEMTPVELKAWIKSTTETLPADSVLKLKIHGKLPRDVLEILKAANLRSLAPATMNISTTFIDDHRYSRYKQRTFADHNPTGDN